MEKIKFIKKYAEKEIGDIVNCSKKSAESAVSQGYAEYVNEEKKTSGIDLEKEWEKHKAGKKESNPGIEDQELKKALVEEMQEQRIESYKENEINWLDDPYWNSWDKVKGHMKKIWGHKEEFDEDKIHKWLFLAHSNDTIKGIPYPVEDVLKTIPLVRRAIKKLTQGTGKDKEEMNIQSFHCLDEKLDTRYQGYLKDAFALDFRIYKIKTEEGKEYYIFSETELPNCTCDFKGMLIKLDDYAEMSRNLKIKSVSKIFLLKSFEPSIKSLSPEQIVQFTQERKIAEKDWKDFLDYHHLGNFNRFPEETNMLRSAFILAGKKEEYPFHLAIVGPPGTKKTMGHIETLAHKFSDDPLICEGANSRIKGLSPSFKEKPANIGYLAKCERLAAVDEIGKMVEFETVKSHNPVNNVLGELNFLLEHKKRIVGSGNDNDVKVQATSKFLLTLNPISNRSHISAHVGLIDPSTMSRMFWWVQDEKEQEFLFSKESIEEIPRTPRQDLILTKDKVSNTNNTNNNKGLSTCSGNIMNRDEFLTLFDSCYKFTCDIDNKIVEKFVTTTTMLAREPMKSSVWKPRAKHHVFLLIDGLVKHRCLFKDYDPTFTPKEEDYDMAERILIRMVNGWETNLLPKEQFQ